LRQPPGALLFGKINWIVKVKKQTTPTPDADTEGRILDAARRVFIRRGTAGARMQEIAEEAGVNQALLHYYFRSKARLADRVFVEAAGRLAQTLAPLASESTSLEALIERFVHGYIDAVRQTPFLPAYLLAEMHHHPERTKELIARATGVVPAEMAAGAIARLQRLIAAAVAAGAVRPIAPHQLLINVVSLVAFPFAARPVLAGALGLDDAGFQRLLDERRAELPRFILNALRP
jgi:AcrR family transcriptional regulator